MAFAAGREARPRSTSNGNPIALDPARSQENILDAYEWQARRRAAYRRASLNDISGRSAISRIYNRAIYASEKAAALALWAEHLTALVEDRPPKIVALRA